MFEDKQLCMPKSITKLEDVILAETIEIDASPVTYSCAANAALIEDGQANRAFDKKRSRGRIDGLVTIAMAVSAAAMSEQPKKSVYARRGAGGRTGVIGVAINERMALRNSTYFRALSLQCGSIGMLPLHLRRRDGRNVEKATSHPLFNVLHKKPNDFQTASRFKSYMQLCAINDGNAYALKVKSRGAVRQLIPLPRRRVKPRLTDTFELVFDYDRPSGGRITLTTDDVFHFGTPLTVDGINGISMLDVAADTLGIAVTAQQAASRMLTKGSIARSALETDQTLGDEAIANLKDSLRENYAGTEAPDDWLILEEGLKAKAFGYNAKDSQLIELMKREAEEIARFTGVPRPLLMFDETSWGSGIEQLSLFFITYCLMPWFVIWEEAVWMWLLIAMAGDTIARRAEC